MYTCTHASMHTYKHALQCNPVQCNAVQHCMHPYTQMPVYISIHRQKQLFFFVYTSMKTCIFKCIMYEKTHDCVGESRASEGANLLVAVSTLGSGEASKQWIGRRTQKRPRKVEAPKKGRPTKSARVFLISFGSLSS